MKKFRDMLILLRLCAWLLAIIPCQAFGQDASKQDSPKGVSTNRGVSVVPRRDALKQGVSKEVSTSHSDSIVPRQDALQLVLPIGHTGGINSVALSPDGRYALSGSSDCTLKLWDMATGREARSFSGHTDSVNSVSFSPDGRYALSGSSDCTLKLWDVATGREVLSFPGHIRVVESVSFSPDGRYALSYSSLNETLKLWDVTTGKEVRSFHGYGLRTIVGPVSFSPDCRYVFSASWDRTLKLWDMTTGKEVRSFSGHTEDVKLVSFSPDCRYVLSASWDRTLKLWDVTTGEEVHSFSGHTNDVNSVAFSPDCRYVLSASWDKMKLWDVTTGKEVRSFSGHTEDVKLVSFSPDCRYVLSVSWSDETLKLWDVTTGKEVHSFSGHTNDVNSVAFSPDGRYVLSGSSDHTLKLWNVATGQEVRSFSGHTDYVNLVSFSPDGRYYVFSGSKLWDIATGQEVRSFSGHTDYVNSVAFSPDGRYVLSGSDDGTLKLWDVATGEEVRSFSGHVGFVTSVSFSPDGRYVLSGSDDSEWECRDDSILNTLKLWDVATGKEVRSFSGHTDAVKSVAFSPDGRHILSTSLDKTLRLWDVATGKEVRSASGYGQVRYPPGYSRWLTSVEHFYSAAFSPDGRYALYGSDNTLKLWDVTNGGMRSCSRQRAAVYGSLDYTLKLWDVTNGEMRSCSGHTDAVSSIAFSPDSRYALSGSLDNTLKLWDVTTGQEVRSFSGHTNRVNSVSFSPDGRYAFSSSWDNTLKLWDVATGKLLLTRLHIDQTDYMMITPDNYYTASKGALKWISFEVGNKVFPFEQFDLKFNRPDIVLERLGKASPKTIAAYKRLYQKRLRKMGFTEEMLGSDYHAPEVVILSKDIPFSTASRALTFKVRATDSKYLLERINVYINDVPIYGVSGISLRARKVQSVEQDIEVTLANGNNKVQVSVLNVQGVESLKETFSIVYNGQSAKPDVYIVAIGVSKYQQDARYNLDYAAKDAIDLASLYQNEFSRAGKYDKVHVLIITDEEATRENIINAKEFFKQSKVDDLAILFVAGHGLIDDEWNYYYATHDVDFADPQERGLLYEELDNLLDGIPALQKLFLMDTCFSGEIDKIETEVIVADATMAQRANGQVKVRAFIDKRGVTAKQRMSAGALKFQEDLFADLRRGTGGVIISSSSGDEYSFESDTWKNGVFTYCVLKGLKERAADRNKDKNVSVSELQGYVIEQVRRLTNGGQNPTVRRENLENDFVVY